MVNYFVLSIFHPFQQIIPHFLEYSAISTSSIIFFAYSYIYLTSRSTNALPTTQFLMVYCHISPTRVSSVPLIFQISTDSLISTSFISPWTYLLQHHLPFLSKFALMIQILMVCSLTLPPPQPSSQITPKFSNISVIQSLSPNLYSFSYNYMTLNPFNPLFKSPSLMAYSLALPASLPSEPSLNHLASISDNNYPPDSSLNLHSYPSIDIFPTLTNHLLFVFPTCERQYISLHSNSFHSKYSSPPNIFAKNNYYNCNTIINTNININIYYYEINIKNNSYRTTSSAGDIASPDTSIQSSIIVINIIIIQFFPILMNTQPSEITPINQVTFFSDHSSINTSSAITTYKIVAALNSLHTILLLADGTPDPVPHNLDFESDSVDEPYFSIIIGHGPISAPVPPIDPDG